MADPLFSIVIPCFNAEKTLRATLDSICGQTFRDFEVIAVNDGSTDSSLAIMESYSDLLPLKVISQPNTGLGTARNAGILKSTGKFVSFLDADDLWANKKLQRVNQEIKDLKDNVDVICHFENMQRSGIILGVLKHGPYLDYYDLLFKGNSMSPSATTVRRVMLNEVGLFSTDHRLHGAEDWDLWLKLAKYGARIHYIKEVLGDYVLYGDNMSLAPEFFKKTRYVFESHVSTLTRVDPNLALKIGGARALHDLSAARSLLVSGRYIRSFETALKGLLGGLSNAFFWNRVFSKLCSRARRRW